jgi:hypothetical protein
VSARPDSMRIVPELRAAHIERHRLGTPAELLYLDTNYDLAGTDLAPGIERVTVAGALRRFLTTTATTLEVPEPLWMRFWPKHVLLATGFHVAGLLRRRPHRVVTYAMENNDLRTLVGGRRRAPSVVVRLVALLVGAVARLTIDRIAFASDDARATYTALPFFHPRDASTVLELPSASPEVADGVPFRCVFLGALEPRKGLTELMAAWPEVEAVVPGAELVVVGPGPMLDTVERWAAERPGSRTVLGGRPRDEALAVVRSGTVLVAPSVPEGRWREQIGLPIKEALAAGLTVVTTDQTGLAPWLRSTGHHIVRAGAVPELAEAVATALRSPLDRTAVRDTLPDVDGRLVADGRLHARSDTSRSVVVLNTLGGALAHYTDALVGTLRSVGTRAAVVAIDEPSVAGGSGLDWCRRYLDAVLRLRRTARRPGTRLLVTWPVLGHVDRLILAAVLPRRSDVTLVIHDPRPLVRAHGYGRVARTVARLGRRVHIVVHSETARVALQQECPDIRPDVLPLPLVTRDPAVHRSASDEAPRRRPIVRVLGQYKPDRDVALLEAVGDRLGATHDLQVIGRRWPEIPGWQVTDEFVPEDRLDALMSSADVVLVPYRRFYQSAIAARCLELGTPAVGPAGSSIADFYPDDRFLASDVESWCAAIADAAAVSETEVVDIGRRYQAATTAAWAEWAHR